MLNFTKSMAALIAAAAFSAPAAAGDAAMLELHWAGAFEDIGDPPIAPFNLLDSPDGFVAAFQTTDKILLSDFGGGEITTYAQDGLAALLGVPPEVLNNADVVIFECNSDTGGGFEGSSWTFSGGAAEETLLATDAIAEGVVTSSAYSQFFAAPFGTCSGDWPFILFNLTEVDPEASELMLLVQAGADQSDTPEPDAVGIIKTTPTTPTCPADLDDSENVDSADLNLLLANFGCQQSCTADISGDGAVDSEDLNLLLAVFGTACS